MLRIAINKTPSEQRWILQGRLAGPWIPELRANWETTQGERKGRKCVVDLSDVTFIDENGQEVLKAMIVEGAQFITCGMCTRYLLDKLGRALRSSEAPGYTVTDCDDSPPREPRESAIGEPASD